METPSYIRPSTPQPLLHRAPDKPDTTDNPFTKPSKYIILLLAPTSVAGKVQIATSVAASLSCPLSQGDSLHESSAKAATVGASRSNDGGKGRYQRMWLSKMTRTGLLFPEESRPATEGFSGFGVRSSASTSRRGSGSSTSSTTSLDVDSTARSTVLSTVDTRTPRMSSSGVVGTSQYINQPVLAFSEEDGRRKSNPALMVLTHPELEVWHKETIRTATGEYEIGIIFVPLFKTDVQPDDRVEELEEDDLPLLRPLDPSTISGFTSFDALLAAQGGEQKLKYGYGKQGNLEEEMVLEVGVGGSVEEIIEEIVGGVKDVMFA